MPTITIDTEELQDLAQRLLPFRCPPSGDESALSHLHVAPSADGLRWTATDSHRMGCLHRGTSNLEEPVLLPAQLVDFAHRAASRSEVDTVTFEVDAEDGTVALVLPELRVPRPLPQVEYPDVDHFLDEAPAHTPTRLTFRIENLRAALHATITFQELEQQPNQAVALRSAGEGTLDVVTRWPGAPDTWASIPATSDGPVDAVVNARYLLDLLEAAGSVEVTLFIAAPTDPVRVRTDDGFHALLMPIHLGQPELERKVAAWLGMDRDDLYVDEDGWIPISTREDTQIWVYLLETDDPFRRRSMVRFSTTLAEDVPGTPELFAEINDLNRQATMCRILHADDQVHVAAEYLLDTLDHDEIDAVCRELDHHVQLFRPLFEAVHRS